MILLGKVLAPFGVQGHLKVFSYTDPPGALFGYRHWHLAHDAPNNPNSLDVEVIAHRHHGARLVVKLKDLDTREATESWIGAHIYVAELATLPEGEYYWCELVGKEVVNEAGEALGVVREMIATGANDVMRVVGAHTYLIPYVHGVYVQDIGEAIVVHFSADWHE